MQDPMRSSSDDTVAHQIQSRSAPDQQSEPSSHSAKQGQAAAGSNQTVTANHPGTWVQPLPGRFDAEPQAATLQPHVDVSIAQDARARPGAQSAE